MVTKKLKKEIAKEEVLENEIVIDSNIAEKAMDIAIVEVLSKDNQVVRVYSSEVHGDDFMKLAEGFANKKGYTLK